uniref:Uncharacterized protein LOC111109556 n=1 Tax=Crassostrea virginica TaxID=6565 RepID=A0A8B8BF70_CRAVI|nr:uncharacterized protein LOC111109556 [Crassostrea virginica]
MSSVDTLRVNLQDLFEEYAWKKFTEDWNIVKRVFRRRSKYYFGIRWELLEFKHETTKYDDRLEAVNATPGGVSISGESGAKSGCPMVSNDVVLYQAEYKNKTPLKQEYTFSSTRQTTSSTTVELHETYTKGHECNIEISVPGDAVTVGAGLSGNLSVSKIDQESFESTTTWTVDTKVEVESGHRAEAKVYVSERNSIADFEVKTTMKIVDGKDFPIVIRRMSDDKIVYVTYVRFLEDVFWDLIQKDEEDENKDKEPKKFQLSEYIDKSELRTVPLRRHEIITYTRGTCKSVSWKNQHVEVQSERMSSYTALE